MEILARTFPEHEERVNRTLDEFDRRHSGLIADITGRTDALHEAFVNHKHDLPPVEPTRQAERTVVDALDSPVRAVDEALGDAVPTPEAPERAEVEAPKALKRATVYRSHLHRHG